MIPSRPTSPRECRNEKSPASDCPCRSQPSILRSYERVRLGSAETKRRILAVTAGMLETTSSERLRVVDIADEAYIAVPTIYYHFTSRKRLIAEAQALVFDNLSKPLQGIIEMAEIALANRDEIVFWEMVGKHILLGWRLGQRDDERGVLKVLRDVLSDPNTRRDFEHGVKESFARLLKLIEDAKTLGWADQSIDTSALIASFWAASSGQTIVGSSLPAHISPERIRDLFLNFAKSRGRP